MPNGTQTPAQVLVGAPDIGDQAVVNAPYPPPGNLPATMRPVPSLPPVAVAGPAPVPAPLPPPTPTQVASHNRHAAIGKAASFLFGQERDPDTGEPVKQAPGAVFRSLLAGALLGGAMAAPEKGGGFLTGFLKGGAASAQQDYQRQQDALARQREQQRLDLEQQRVNDEHTEHAASVAHLTALTTQIHHQQTIMDQDRLEQKNAAAQAYIQGLEANGGMAARIAINGVIPSSNEYAAPDLAAAFMKDPALLHGPQGTTRHFVDLHDLQDIDYVRGKGWLDARGNPVDLSDHTMVRAYDVPDDIYKKPFLQKKSQLNALAGHPLYPPEQGDQEVWTTIAANDGLYNQNLKNQNEQAQANQRKAEQQAQQAEADLRRTQIRAMGNIGVPVSENWTPDPNSFAKSSRDLKAQLAQQGQQLPPDWETLYQVGHYDGKMGTYYSSRPYNRPGMPLQKSAAQASNFIRTFINPSYDENQYDAIRQMEIEYAKTTPNTAGGNGIAFNTATRHLGMLYDASLALHNGQAPAYNAIAQWLSVQSGKNVKPNFDSIRNALVGELGKTFKGGTPDIPEREQLEDTIKSSMSPEQLLQSGVIQTYAGLMKSKVDALDQHYFSLKGRHPANLIDPEAEKVYQKLGLGMAAPPSSAQLTNIQINPQTRQQIGWDGRQWVDATTRQPVK